LHGENIIDPERPRRARHLAERPHNAVPHAQHAHHALRKTAVSGLVDDLDATADVLRDHDDHPEQVFAYVVYANIRSVFKRKRKKPANKAGEYHLLYFVINSITFSGE